MAPWSTLHPAASLAPPLVTENWRLGVVIVPLSIVTTTVGSLGASVTEAPSLRVASAPNFNPPSPSWIWPDAPSSPPNPKGPLSPSENGLPCPALAQLTNPMAAAMAAGATDHAAQRRNASKSLVFT